MASVDLPDQNVWLALSMPGHPHHARARDYWEADSAVKVVFCSHTLVGLARLLTNVSGMAGSPLTVEGAWAVCRTWLRESNVSLASEPRKCHVVLDAFVVEGLLRPETWPDAYLAAFATSGKMRLVSFDSDFASFPALDWLHLAG